ncbi:MAG: alpha/beta fold hydrolase [Acidimicrobiales bacterium]
MSTEATDEPSLLLIHGLGATSGVWADLVAHLQASGSAWPGRVITPDLPGHGSSTWSGDYTVGALAAAVSANCGDGEEVVIIGHSLGGGVALALASGFFRPVVRSVIGLGIKVAWSEQDVVGMAKVAAKGVRWFDSAEEATDRALLQAGLAGLVDSDHPATVNAVTQGAGENEGHWRVAQDPATFAQRALDFRGLMDAARCEVILGAGEGDAMVSAADLQQYVHQPRIAAGRGHNVQVEDPAWVAGLLEEVRNGQ